MTEAPVAFRADAAFARPAIYEALEQRDVDYAIRMPANKTLELAVEDILFRPPGRPSCTPLVRYKSFRSQAKSWTTARRIVAKVEHHRGELFPRVGFIVTNMVLPSRSVVRFCNKRGTAEQWIKEGKQATHWTRLSCHRFRANEVRLQLSVLAYTLGNLWRRLVLPPRIKRWSLTSLQQRLVKTGGRLVKHARYWVYPGFPTLFWGLSVFFVGDLMGKALWKLVENAARFPRRGGRVLCVHGAVSFHRARPCGPRWLPGRGAMRHVELDRRVLGLQSNR